MSVDTTDLDRSTLAAKKRDELVAIVTAMGGSPASRAAKGDLVDQIVDLAGSGDSNGSGNADLRDEHKAGDQGAQNGAQGIDTI